MEKVVQTSNTLISELNKLDGVNISALKNGTHIYDLRLAAEISLKKLAIYLYDEHSIWVGRADDLGIVKFAVNESLLTRSYTEIIAAWKKGIELARG